MIEQAWNEYRGWAKRARSLRASADRWNLWAMIALVATGVLGAASGFFGANPTDWLPAWAPADQFARALACVAAVASALSLYVGRQALAVGAESGWLRARATAEAIKSECFRFAGGVGDYAPGKASEGDAATAFIERRKAIAARAAGESLTPEDDPVGSSGDDRRPSPAMTDKWYLANRINGQIKFYRDGQEKNESGYQRLQLWTFVVGAIIAVVSAVAAVYGARFAAWIGALTTLGAAVSAYGLAERRKYLAASYAAMKANLERLKERYLVGDVTLQSLVATAEDLMESEHAAWIDQMAKTIRPAPSPRRDVDGSEVHAEDHIAEGPILTLNGVPVVVLDGATGAVKSVAPGVAEAVVKQTVELVLGVNQGLSVDEMEHFARARRAESPPVTGRPRARPENAQPAGTVEEIVECSVFGPPAAPPGKTILIQVFLHLADQAERASFLASTMDASAKLKGAKPLDLPVKREARVEIAFSANGLTVDEPVQSVVWQGEPTFCQFQATIPAGTKGKSFLPVVRISVDGKLVGRIAFSLSSDDAASQPASELLGDHAKLYKYAFVSYASKDREEVLKRVQMLEVLKTQFFQDVLSLDPGDRWEKKLYENIDRCDLFLLFWSQAAKDSQWVLKEAEYALAHQQKNPQSEPDLVPVVLEQHVSPPANLSAFHFNDRISYLISRKL